MLNILDKYHVKKRKMYYILFFFLFFMFFLIKFSIQSFETSLILCPMIIQYYLSFHSLPSHLQLQQQAMKHATSQLSCYLLDKTIGKGTFGKVKRAIHRHTGEPVAIKILEKDKIRDITDVERVSRELHILKLVRHSSIAQLYEIVESPDRIFIVMEYAQNGEFFDYIMDGRVKNQREAHYYFAQIISGLEYMHRLCITHRDIKPENMLLDVQNRLKIVDFGLSNMYKRGEKLVTACGSPCYASPEMIKGQLYDPELTDVWSLGIVLFTMIMAKLPFEDDNTSVLYSKIKSGLYIIDKKVSPQYKDLLSRLVNVKPENRLRLSQIRKHPWFVAFSKVNSFGINVGFDKIPIDDKIVTVMEGFGFAPVQTKRYLQYNIKNQCTTTYYLFLKKNFKLGLASIADICSQNFNEELMQKVVRRKRHKSIDFNALVQRSDPNKEEPTDSSLKFQDRKCRSVMKNIHIDTHSVGRSSFDRGDNNSIKVHFRRNLNNNTSKSKERDSREGRGDIHSLLERRSKSRKQRTDENDYRVAVNRLIKQNRRLQTEHVRQVYGKDFRQSYKRELQVSEMFWKKRNPNQSSKGQTRYVQNDRVRSSKKNLKNSSG